MIENYKMLENGVIKQINVSPINYNNDYINNSYNKYGELGLRMSYLRYGYIIGSIGYIPESILDVGYGNGDFLKVCKKTISNCYGNDISGYTIPDDCIFTDDIKINVDVITFFDSLEHFHDIDFVRDLNAKYIVISAPWCHYHSDEWFCEWKHRRPNEHIFHFNEKSMEKFMLENGYKLVTFSNIEDIIRNGKDEKNILTAVFRKNNI